MSKGDNDSLLIEGRSGDWEVVIGCEVHAQVISKAKLFSGAGTAFGAAPNSQVSLVDAAMPGMLPVINEACVEQAVRTGLALEAEINLTSVFDRKNFFYPDLPPGYQISQFSQPIVGHGEIVLDLGNGATRTVGITRLHLEQDAGKSLHDRGANATHVDLNRAGIALMEIVSEPDMRSAEEAGAYMRKLRSILRYVGSCDGNMEEGSLRCDVNVSVRRPGAALGTRTETKNVNSIRFIIRAVEYEAARQVEVIEDGGEVVQETRLFDDQRGVTRPMRSKEEAQDYRYFPDPDLLPLTLDADWVKSLRAGLPELPDAKKARFEAEYGLSAYNASVLVAEREIADYFEAVARGRDGKLAANWVTVELFGRLNKAGLEIADCPVSAQALGDLVGLVADGTISGRIAKDVFDEMFETGRKAAEIIETKGLRQVSDPGAIEAIVDDIVAANPEQAAQAQKNPKVIGWFVGQVMKATKG
ncbi:MAG: Asp-tRNA(Asn)/Glu-tRNA(Gln) amidotransferase subunit GatB, partial [Alphaproteobacteria bacterium]